MKKLLTILPILLTCYLFAQDGVQYKPVVAWKTNVDSVIYQNTDTFIVKINPFDYNDPGAINRVIGDYLMDYTGNIYTIIDSTSSTVTVVDEFDLDAAPQQGQEGIVYRSLGGGVAPFAGQINYARLDQSAKDNADAIFKAVLWNETAKYTDSTTVFVTPNQLSDSLATIVSGSSPWTESGDSVYVTGKNVGIGTSAPEILIHAYKDQNAGTKFTIDNPNTGTGAFTQFELESGASSLYGYGFGSNYTTSGRFLQSSGLLDASGSGGLGLAASNSLGNINFYTNGNNQRLKIDSIGNVGIGLTHPTVKLEVQGRGYFYNEDASDAAIIAAINTDGIGGATFTMKDEASGGYWDFKTTQTTGDFKLRDQQNSNDVVYIEAGASANSLFIDSDGLFGINNASPAYRFDVVENSTSYISKMYNSNADGQGLWVQAGNVLNDDYILRLEAQNGIDRFSVKTDGGVFMNYIQNASQSYVLGWNSSTKEVTYFTTPSGGGASELSDLSDVNTSTPTSGNLLIADGVDWESVAMSGDMYISSSGTTTAQTLLINGKGENTSLASTDRMLLYDASGGDLDYVTLSTLDTYFGGGASQLTDLSDVSSATATSGNMLIANGSTFASQSISGDVTINSSGVTAVSDDSHNHTASTLSGVAEISGTPVSDEIAVWTDANTITGATGFEIDNDTMKMPFVKVDGLSFTYGNDAGIVRSIDGDLVLVDGNAGSLTLSELSGGSYDLEVLTGSDTWTGTKSFTFSYDGNQDDIQIVNVKISVYSTDKTSIGYGEFLGYVYSSGAGTNSHVTAVELGNVTSVTMTASSVNDEFTVSITTNSSKEYNYKITKEWVQVYN